MVFWMITIQSMMHEMLRPHEQNNLWELEQAFCLKNSFGLECNVRQKHRRTLISYFKLSYTSGLTWFHHTTRYISFWLEVIQVKWTVFRNIVTLYWQIPPQIQNANTNWIKTFYNRTSFLITTTTSGPASNADGFSRSVWMYEYTTMMR